MRKIRNMAVLFLFIGMLAWPARLVHSFSAAPFSPALQSASITFLPECPASGCAPGQRLNLVYDFTLETYTPSANPNVLACIYVPTGWSTATLSTDAVLGELSEVEYRYRSDCGSAQTPADYRLLEAREATITDQTIFADTIQIAFRLVNAPGNARIMVRLYENADELGFTQTDELLSEPLRTAAPSNIVFVANTVSKCGSNSPCYLDSNADLINGVGTGLRDAVEAVNPGSEIHINTEYAIGSNSVVIDKQVRLIGDNPGSITFDGIGNCTQPMLTLKAATTISGLVISDGPCNNPNRNLIEITSNEPVLIEYNTLTGGANAISMPTNSSPVTIRYNNITGNSGFAVFAETTSASGSLNILLNNLQNNRAGDPIQCSGTAAQAVASSKANHNYFGSSIPTMDTSKCTIDPAKRLGAPIVSRSNAAGVQVQLVNVETTKRYYYEDQIAVSRTGGSDFPLYIIDHGFLSDPGAPFTFAAGLDSPYPCSNYWDIFLPDGVTTTGSVNLSFKYDKTTTCEALIDSVQFCGQANTTLYPLLWFDPTTDGVTNSWDNAGQRPEKIPAATPSEGQALTCDTTRNEITAIIDSSGRPALSSDLNFTPFFVGVPILSSFQVQPSSQAVTITWTTKNEPDITGFYVLRGTDGVNFGTVSPFITRRGSTLQGVTSPAYSFTNSGLASGQQYYYRLQIVLQSNPQDNRLNIYSEIKPVIASAPTVTPTRTLTPIPPTPTASRTFVPQQFPTLIPSLTATEETPIPTPTVYDFNDAYPVDETVVFEQALTIAAGGTPVAMLPETATPSPSASPTVFPQPTPPVEQPARPWLSLGLGILAGSLIVGALAGWLWITKLR